MTDIGLEREYALLAWEGDTVSYLLANERLELPELAGWRVAPEYSRCLVEIASPPVTRDGWDELLATYARLEEQLAASAARLASRFDRVACTAEWSLRTDRFVSWDGEVVTDYAALLLPGAHANLLLGAPADVPPCLLGSSPELLYAGFTSTNATLRPAVDDAGYGARLLHAARELATPPRHPILRGGRVPVEPAPDASIRDALVRWGDRSSSYTMRAKVVAGATLYELRCFHSGQPLASLAPLLEVA